MNIPPKAPSRKYKICEGDTCGNCQGCKRTEGYQSCKYAPNPSKPIPSVDISPPSILTVAVITLGAVALILLGFVIGAEVIK